MGVEGEDDPMEPCSSGRDGWEVWADSLSIGQVTTSNVHTGQEKGEPFRLGETTPEWWENLHHPVE